VIVGDQAIECRSEPACSSETSADSSRPHDRALANQTRGAFLARKEVISDQDFRAFTSKHSAHLVRHRMRRRCFRKTKARTDVAPESNKAQWAARVSTNEAAELAGVSRATVAKVAQGHPLPFFS